MAVTHDTCCRHCYVHSCCCFYSEVVNVRDAVFVVVAAFFLSLSILLGMKQSLTFC